MHWTLQPIEINGWIRADLFLVPPNDVNCSDEDSADEEDPQLHNLSKKQLLADCELKLIKNDDEIIGEKEVAEAEPNSSSPNNWKYSEGENEKQAQLRAKVVSFKPPKNLVIEQMDNENYNSTPIRAFELFFDEKLVSHIV